MAITLALISAALFALGTVLEERALLALAHRRVWLVGMAVDGLAVLAQAGALDAGQLSVVQPLLSSSLVFALPLAAALEGRRVGRTPMLAALVVTGGLGMFLLLADPAGGRTDVATTTWLIAFAACGVIAAALALGGRRGSPTRRAALLGAAGGVLLGLAAALLKATVARLGDAGVVATLGSGVFWALVVVGAAATALVQASLRHGRLGPAIATQLALDPITAMALGTAAFGERIHEHAAGAIGACAGVAIMLAGIVWLALAEDQPPSRLTMGENSLALAQTHW
jgi:drug/metabolite transporter (DMT)-like permease